MDTIDMLQAAVLMFALTAAGGLVMAAIRMFGKRNPPAWLSMVHGIVATAGLTLLAYPALVGDVPSPAGWSLLLFLLAAGGGAAMNLLWQWRDRPLPVALILVHAGIAVVAFALLVAAAF